jgi:1-acyl-sn-glycerol-3-phosphate acyltransferase
VQDRLRSAHDEQGVAAGGEPRPTTPPARTIDPTQVLAIARALALELQPERARTLVVALDSRIDRDLGIDSLGRAELALRLQRDLGVAFADTDIAETETVGDLIRALGRVAGAPTAVFEEKIASLALEPVDAQPLSARTLIELLHWRIERHPERLHIALSDGDVTERTISFRELSTSARGVANGLIAAGLEPGDRAAIMLPTGAEFFQAFYGILYAGGIPVPMYPPARLSQLEDHLRRQVTILDNSGAKLLITVAEARRVAGLLTAGAKGFRAGITTVPDLLKADERALPPPPKPEDIAFLQYTSGSTGDPKGVVLSHANLMANIRAMVQALDANSRDVVVSWLPLYHDMGLIGAWLGSLYAAAPALIMSPLAFLTRPVRWLRAIHRHKGTISVAPNFAFELCARRIDEAELEGLDLSSLRFLGNGAEAVGADTLKRFIDRFRKYGFKPEALAPVYGLAECSVGLTFPPLGRAPLIDRIDREALARTAEAVPAKADDPNAIEVVACGRPLPGHEVRIVDDQGIELGERREGRLEFRGPSATSGYFRNETATRTLFDDGWLDSGDYAYIAGGDVYITGRRKDVIIRAGRNVHPEEIEQAVVGVSGVRRGCVAAFGVTDPRRGTEKLVVVAETREERTEALAAIRTQIANTIAELFDGPPEDVVLVGPHRVPKTSSGKIRRTATRELYLNGRLKSGPSAVWVQFLRLGLAAARAEAGRYLRAGRTWAYAGYWWLVVGLAIGLASAAIMVLPKPAWRWRVSHLAAKTALALIGLKPAVAGVEHAKNRGVFVSNHASYLDGLVLIATMAEPVAFIGKRELRNQFPAGVILSGLGTLFVDRADAEAAARETAEATQAALSGQNLLFFSEGTLTRRPGLLAFRLGAFVVACQANLPIIPVTLTGTRSVLRADQWFPQPGHLKVVFDPPLVADGVDLSAAIRLRDRARAIILQRCGEPDLAAERIVFTAAGVEAA